MEKIGPKVQPYAQDVKVGQRKLFYIFFNVKLDHFAEQSRINVRIKILVILKANCFHEILELFVQLKLSNMR